eukprot:TRINITY_DN13596_c0_g1_i4.p1 TRINITY_DN13596_c0_g1~~TRINITY_DN13596_c0_g1_i4.p1  ORF type:complete len:225 (+),score=41.36 TRINITY_DN13596_c0_g1_i4:353-1027(+)
MKPRTPVLHSLYFETPSRKLLTEDRGFYELELEKVYEVVLQNYPACNGVCETHPWHLHGHKFWVVGTWPGEFNGTVPAGGSGGKVHRRDTTMIIGEGMEHRPDARAGCGFTVLRFKADNPGAWNFHCHALWHSVMGMEVVFYTAPAEIAPPPEQLPLCGDVTLAVAFERLLRGRRLQARQAPLQAEAESILSSASSHADSRYGLITALLLAHMCALALLMNAAS